MFVNEKDFLPAALEILEKPASPLGSLTIWLICGFFSLTLAWSIIGKIDVVAVAQGKIVPVGQTKTLQSFHNGVVKRILVDNGSRVEQGDVLIELDPTDNTADVASLTQELHTAMLNDYRNTWLLESITSDSLPVFDIPIDVSTERKLLEESHVISRLSEYKATSQAFVERISEKENEYRVVAGEIEKLKETLPLLQEQMDGLKELSDEGIASRFKYLERKEMYVSRKRDFTIEKDKLKQIEASIRGLKNQKSQYLEETKSKYISDLSEAKNQLAAVRQELVKAENVQSLMVVRAPVTGVVQQLIVHTIGGVIKSSEPLMVIVPENRELQVEMTILNKDIGFVRVGHDAEIKLEAFPFTKYGVIHGKVLSIDHDALQDEQLGLVYPARVSMASSTIHVNDSDLPLTPGMGLSTEIKIGKRRIIEFILAPIFRYKSESLRER